MISSPCLADDHLDPEGRSARFAALVGARQVELDDRDPREDRGDEQERHEHDHQVHEGGHVELGHVSLWRRR